MTTREYFQAVLDAHLSDEMDAASVALLQKLDARNAKRKTTDTKEKTAAKERKQVVHDFLVAHRGEQFTRDMIAEATGMSGAQVTGACRGLDGIVTKSEAKIDKVRRVVYTIQ